MPGYLERLPVAKLLLAGATGFVKMPVMQALEWRYEKSL